ncbi:GNAT family N-acetyltransferase [Piscibacillus sp. B03]|uniref:GNAT family N-acetyltransferase n=1 Tax=Piscibacillus sp. B03 TaxID=3457430 RepID=UPI003FCD7CC6
MNTRRPKKLDYELIDRLCKLSYENETQWIGYPRVENIEVLKAEIAEYNNTLEDSVLMIENCSETVGFTGYLHEKGDQEAYIIGPVLIGDYHTSENISGVLSTLKAESIFSTLLITTPSNNLVTNSALQQQDWKQISAQLEMVYKLSEVNKSEQLTLVSEVGQAEIPSVGALFADASQWDNAEERLRHYLSEFGMKAVCITDDNELKGAILWDEVKGTNFVRLEDVAVNSKARRQGIATKLINHVINEASKQSKKDIFLAVDLDNDKAIQLYEKLGFKRNMVNYSYETSS